MAEYWFYLCPICWGDVIEIVIVILVSVAKFLFEFDDTLMIIKWSFNVHWWSGSFQILHKLFHSIESNCLVKCSKLGVKWLAFNDDDGDGDYDDDDDDDDDDECEQ